MKNIHATIPAQVFLLLLTVFLISSGARTYEITGTLVTEHSEPIANHQVVLYDDNDDQIAIDQTDSHGNFTLAYQGEPTSAEPGSGPDSPMEFKLGSSYPNPFNPRTVIPFQVPKRTNAVIAVYNILGQEVMRTRSELGKGSHEIEVNLGAGLSQGTYLLRVQGDGYSLTRAMTFVSAGISSGRAGIRISSGGQVQRSISGNSQAAAEPGMYRLVVEGTEVYQQKEVMIPSHDDFEDFEYEAGFIMVFFREPVEMMDSDGNVYQTVKIGDQWWMAENLKVTRYRNGDPIPNVKNSADWESLVTGAYSTYNNLDPYAQTYGYLYNWHVLNDVRNIAPEGWRVPSDQDWQDLVDHLGGEEVAGGKMKEEGTAHWTSPNTGATNESGFTALPGGFRALGPFYFIGDLANFWTATEDNADEAWYWAMEYTSANIGRSTGDKSGGLSLRLIRDTSPEPSMTGIEISPQEESIESGESMPFAALAHFSDLSEKDATGASEWSVSPSEAGAIDGNGLFTVSTSYTGPATITASYNEFADEADLTITPETGTMTDQDGNVYQTIRIGDQWWMAENLKVSHYRNGDLIPNVTDNLAWSDKTAGAYSAYNNHGMNGDTYGYLYNWHVVNDVREIAPEGWRVPWDTEWQGIVDILGGSNVAGGKMKQTGTMYWNTPNDGATNESGFSALPGGRRNSNGSFVHMGDVASFWTSTWDDDERAWHYRLDADNANIYRLTNRKEFGFSLRLIMETEPSPPVTGIEIISEDYTIVGLGEFKQFTARAIYLNASTKEATEASQWLVSPSYAGNIDDSGLFTASSSYTGAATITVVYDEFSDDLDVMIVSATDTMTDQDGNVYLTVKIGDQWWMAENLRVTHYRNGDPIANVSSNSVWADHDTGAYCAYDNKEVIADTYGYLYNWHAASDSRNIAPSGWRVPTEEDWKTMEKSIGLSNTEANDTGYRGTDEGGKLKTKGTKYWKDPNKGATNEYGFSSLGGGFRTPFGDSGLRENAYFWSATEDSDKTSWYRGLHTNLTQINRGTELKNAGFQIRLIRE